MKRIYFDNGSTSFPKAPGVSDAVKFLLDNGSPLDMYLNANITSYSGTHQSDIHIGDCTPIHGDSHSDHATAPVSIAANSEAEYYFSRRGHHDTSNGTDIELEHIGDMIRELPDSIVIHDISVETDDSFVNVVANQNCNVEMEYEFFCPLAFGKDLNISFDYDIDLGFDGESVGIDSLVISMNMVNTIPLDFAITGVALDADGNEIRNASVDLDLDLAAGTLDAPVESPAEVVISTSGLASVEKLRLKLTATSSRAMEGKILNTAQGLGINDLHVTLPNGINLDLSSDENEIFE